MMQKLFLTLAFSIAITFILGAGGVIAQSGSNPPGILFSTVLNAFKLDHQTCEFYFSSMDDLQPVFLPDMPMAPSGFPYSPKDGGDFHAIMYTGSGSEVALFEFRLEQLNPPFWLSNSYDITVLDPAYTFDVERIKLTPGDYYVDFFVEGEKMYHEEFSIDVIPSPDPFSPGDFYFLEGDWNNWGYFLYGNADPGQSLLWKVWLRNKAHESEGEYKINIEVKNSAGALICQNRGLMTYYLQPEWKRYEFDMIFPPEGTSGGGYFKAKDLLDHDGSYSLTMKLNDEVYGVWNFEISAGKFVLKGRADRATADPLTFIEGGRDAFWFGK